MIARRAADDTDAIMAGDASSDDFANLEVPDHYTAALLRKEDESMFDGMPTCFAKSTSM